MTIPDAALVGFETRDASPARVLFWGAALISALAMFAGGVWLTIDAPRGPPDPNRQEAGTRQPAAPRLQASPAADAAVYHAAMDAKLRGYGWTDRARGVARIPVATAMDILSEQGWPKESSP